MGADARMLQHRVTWSLPPFSPTPTQRIKPSLAPQAGRRAFLAEVAGALVSVSVVSRAPAWAAKPEGVNRPELLPPEVMPILDLEHFLTSGQRQRLADEIARVEHVSGLRLRVLTQRFPQTPGAAVRDYWSVDESTIVMVADYFGGSGALLKFNVGKTVDAILPARFWTLLSARYGNQYYIREHGEDGAILGAVDAISRCVDQFLATGALCREP